jgi:hypothetical protein
MSRQRLEAQIIQFPGSGVRIELPIPERVIKLRKPVAELT